MRISEKIEIKKYIFLSISLLLTSFVLARGANEALIIALVFLAACLNQWLLLKGVYEITSTASSGEKKKGSTTFLFLIKPLVLIFPLVFGVQIMGKRILIPVFIYVVQIAILFVSLKKKKG